LLLSTSTYFVFLVGIFFLYWSVSRVRALALSVLLFANYFFYARWNLWYLAIIPLASTCDYFIGLGLQATPNRVLRRILVTLSVVLNIGLIALARNWKLSITLSFYAFQALTYTIDLYRRDILGQLGFDPEAATVVSGYDGTSGISGLVAKLLDCSDETILDALVVAMAETLEAGTPLIELLGRHLKIDMADSWSADRALLDLIKDREVLDAMVAELAGGEAAEANARATGKVKRQIVADCLNGINGRAKVERFVPKWMAFPPGAYTDRGGVATVNRAAVVEQLLPTPGDEQVGCEASGAVQGDSQIAEAGGSEAASEPQPMAEAA